MADMDVASNRADFYAGLPGKYAKNTGFSCNNEEGKARHLKKLREAMQTNVLEKLRNCRDQDVPLLLRWFRTCQYEQEHDDAGLYLCPKYAPCCETAGVVRLEHLGENMYAPTGSDTSADSAKKVSKAVTEGKSINTLNKDSPDDAQKIQNFVYHHKRVFDVVKDANKMTRIKAQMGSLRDIDYSSLLPDCVISPEFAFLAEMDPPLSFANVIDENAANAAADRIKAYISASREIKQPTKDAIAKHVDNMKDEAVAAAQKNDRDGALTILKAMVNPAAHPMPMIRLEQICHTGLYSRQLFMSEVTSSDKIANACRALAAGCHKNCPAANGHLPEAYPLGTVAPGVSKSHSFWVNAIVQKSIFLDGETDGTLVSRCEWVPAPAMMVSTLTTLKKMEEQVHKLVVKEYMCLKQKEGAANRPPCSELDTFNTNAAIVALRSATERLQSKGLSAQQCIGLLGEFDEPRMSRSSGSRKKSRRKRKRRSRN